MERRVPGNPGTRVKNPYIAINPKKDGKLAEKPTSEDKRYMVSETNLY
jgi:hypothetical protein